MRSLLLSLILGGAVLLGSAATASAQQQTLPISRLNYSRFYSTGVYPSRLNYSLGSFYAPIGNYPTYYPGAIYYPGSVYYNYMPASAYYYNPGTIYYYGPGYANTYYVPGGTTYMPGVSYRSYGNYIYGR